MHPRLLFVAVTAVLFISSLLVSLRVYDAHPTLAADEHYHIPQAQNYCRYDFHYSPSITTPPGLYLTSLVLLLPLKLATGSDFCTVFALRFTNVVLMLGNFCVSSLIAIKLAGPCGAKARTKLIVSSAAMSLFPVLFFFTFLYYTDPGAVLFLQIVYLCSLFDRHYIAAIFGAIAVLYRQTSIVWLFMVAGCKALRIADDACRADIPEQSLSCAARRIVSEPVKYAPLVLRVGRRVVYHCAGYILIGLAFLVFLVVNGSIVLGAKGAHVPVFHPPQLGYFLFLTLLHSAPYLLLPSILKDFCTSLLRRPLLYALIVITSVVSIHYFTHVHHYILGSAYHVPNFVWTHVLGRSAIIRHSLVPLYLYTGYAILHRLQHKELSWRLLFCLCVVVAIVPEKLVEPRYFILPYMFFRMHLADVQYWQLLLELATNIAVNAALMRSFLNSGFMW